MGDSLHEQALNACNEDFSEDNEKAAVNAVKDWLKPALKGWGNDVVEEYKSNNMLQVASEKGYLKVVQQLLQNKELVKVEVDRRAKELFLKYTIQEENAHDASRSGFAEALNKLKAKKSECGRVPDDMEVEKYPEWKRSQAEEQARYKACYDMITLYMYIGEEIPDATTLIGVISALHDLGWTNMDDISAYWDKVRKGLHEARNNYDGSWNSYWRTFGLGEGIPSALLDQLSEARYNYDASWDKYFEGEDKAYVGFSFSNECRSALFLFLAAFLLCLIVFVPIIYVLALRSDIVLIDVRIEKQLWLECYVWLGLFALEQFGFALWAAPRSSGGA